MQQGTAYVEDVREICYIWCELSQHWKLRPRRNNNKRNFKKAGCKELGGIQLVQDLMHGQLL
jgi:hypothetical protein